MGHVGFGPLHIVLLTTSSISTPTYSRVPYLTRREGRSPGAERPRVREGGFDRGVGGCQGAERCQVITYEKTAFTEEVNLVDYSRIFY